MKDKIDGLKKAIEIAKKEIDQDQIEKFCNHIGVTQIYFKSETINKIVNALEKEIDRLETIERNNASIQRVDNEITKLSLIHI